MRLEICIEVGDFIDGATQCVVGVECPMTAEPPADLEDAGAIKRICGWFENIALEQERVYKSESWLSIRTAWAVTQVAVENAGQPGGAIPVVRRRHGQTSNRSFQFNAGLLRVRVAPVIH